MISEQALKDRIQAIARERNIPFNACWKRLLLERFLGRLSRSVHRDKFVFKGGFLLSYLVEIGRESTDLDFLLTRVRAERDLLMVMFKEIISADPGDGFAFFPQSIDVLSQPQMEYPGYRLSLEARFARMRDRIQVDLGVGDVVEPINRDILFLHYRGGALFEPVASLPTYPMESIFAEKLESILSKGATNTRMKDYHDLIFIVRNKSMLLENKLRESVRNTLTHRGTLLRTIGFDDFVLKSVQGHWRRHLEGLGGNARKVDLPDDISDIIREINEYILDALLLDRFQN
jgi:predicted nucleotidyltransferase component of viral defense system